MSNPNRIAELYRRALWTLEDQDAARDRFDLRICMGFFLDGAAVNIQASVQQKKRNRVRDNQLTPPGETLCGG